MKKICGNCRYFIKRKIGSYNMGFSISPWGLCEGNKNKDLGAGPGRVGMVRRDWGCRLTPQDWKPKFHIPQSHKRKVRFDSHPHAENPHYDRRWRYLREERLERLKDLGKE